MRAVPIERCGATATLVIEANPAQPSDPVGDVEDDRDDQR